MPFAAFAFASLVLALALLALSLLLFFLPFISLFFSCPKADTRIQRVQDKGSGLFVFPPVMSRRVRKVRNHQIKRAPVVGALANVLRFAELAEAIRTVAVEEVLEAVLCRVVCS
jgi:hypothetical protein